MDEQEIKAEARLTAIELFLSNLYAEKYGDLPNGDVLVREKANLLETALSTVTIPHLDPALSDAVTGEFQEALSNLAGQIVDHVEREIRSRSHDPSI